MAVHRTAPICPDLSDAAASGPATNWMSAANRAQVYCNINAFYVNLNTEYLNAVNVYYIIVSKSSSTASDATGEANLQEQFSNNLYFRQEWKFTTLEKAQTCLKILNV